MKALFDQLIHDDSQSFSLKEAGMYHALNDFHYHPELELIYIINGEGVLLIGDEFRQVFDNTMVLIGSNVPHMFKFSTYAYEHELVKQGMITLPIKLLTLHFDTAKLGENFMLMPENQVINNLLKDASRGLFIYDEDKQHVAALMEKLLVAPVYEHISLLMQLLTAIGLTTNRDFITKSADKNSYNRTDEMRLTKIYLYTLNNFSRVIKLKEIADIVHLVPNAFCRYFKLRTGKSYFTFLMDVRIAHACKLLKEKDYSMVVVCYESGFTNLSNFNRHFKLTTRKTPLEYRKHFQM